ncbi:periodic tryptophan protein 1 homolog [Halichondria panicea]|uniref:periodic tryptophan protein 1 homolog n=1 Tax=Halichondria panicea TaxID=6063 RepID=UPI00312B9106
MSSCVPCLCWVIKGAAKEVPDKVKLSKEEVQGLLQHAQDELKDMGLSDRVTLDVGSGDEEANDDDSSCHDNEKDEGIESLYDLENYDNDKGESMSGAGMGNSLSGLAYFASNEDDPYITLKSVAAQDDDTDDYRVLPSDNLLVVGRAEEDFSSLEVHVYSEGDDHAYSHHEVLLTAFPLALEWMDFDPEQPDKKGNYVAVGSMSPVIEVWDLDVVDSLEPVFVLGDPARLVAGQMMSDKVAAKKDKKKGKNKSSLPAEPADGHSDAVLGLSWNHLVRNVLASASADCTVRVWDMSWPRSVLKLKHKDKVQSVQWHPYSPELLATGGYDKHVHLYNCKGSEKPVRSWNVKGEVEKLVWNHLKPEQLLAATDKSTVWCLDRDDGSVLFQIHAHTGPITALCLSPLVPGLLVTGSADDSLKFWDILDCKPTFLFNRDMHMGAVHCAQFCVDTPYTLAVGGEKNGFHIIDASRLLPVTQRFKKRGFMVPTDGSPTDSSQDVPVTSASEDGHTTEETEESADQDMIGEAMETEEDPKPKPQQRTLASFSKSEQTIKPSKKIGSKRVSKSKLKRKQ